MPNPDSPTAEAFPAAAEVVVIGAGLAGLGCAVRLAAHDVEVVLLESAQSVGGRVRTDVISGFTCDRGFQLLNPSYPEVGRVLDLKQLRVQPFPAAVVVASGGRRHTLADPRRAPGLTARTALSLLNGIGTPREQLSFARWALGTTRRSAATILSEPDTGWADALEKAGVTGEFRSRVVTPFLAGVLGEDSGVSSHRFAQLLVRSFVRGAPGVPWRGMQAIPDQLAAKLSSVHLGIQAESVAPGVVRTSAGQISARCVVVATDPRTAGRLLPAVGPVPMRALTTFWHVSPDRPTRSGALHLDGDRRGPVVNSIVISNRARSYSPDERSLIATTVLGDADDVQTERAVLAQLEHVYGQSTRWWELLKRHVVPAALTAMPPPLDPRRPVDLDDGLFVAGDHRDTASIQGALVSGRRAADAVLARLGLGVPPREPLPA